MEKWGKAGEVEVEVEVEERRGFVGGYIPETQPSPVPNANTELRGGVTACQCGS